MFRTLIISILFLTSLIGQDSKDFSFMGVSVSTQNIKTDFGNVSQKSGFGLKYGQQSLEWRTTFALDYNTNSYYGAYVEVDKILLDDMFGTAKLRPYLGGVAGYMKFGKDELTKQWGSNEAFEETKGFYFGGNFGFIIYATDHIDIDLSYHYYKVQNIDFIDGLHGASLSVHYFF